VELRLRLDWPTSWSGRTDWTLRVGGVDQVGDDDAWGRFACMISLAVYSVNEIRRNKIK
jgi:hypothetical protein